MSEDIVNAAIARFLDDCATTASDPGSIIVPGYVFVRALQGGGGPGNYLAQRESDGKPVVIKLYNPGAVGISARDAEFEILESTARLGGVVRAIEKGGTASTPIGDCPYLVEEYVDGRPLLEYARQKNLTSRERLKLFGEVCRAVEACHVQGTAHLDLKPGHILVVEVEHDGVLPHVIYLIDFGISRRETSAFLGASRCTRKYAAPEQLDGSPRVDTRADVYALGGMLEELLMDGAVPPRPGHGVWRTIVRWWSGTVRRTAPFAGQLRGILERARQPLPLRYQQVSELAIDVDNLLAHRPVTAVFAPWHVRFGMFVRRESRLAIASAILLCLGSGLIATLTRVVWDQHRIRIAEEHTHSARLAAGAAELRREREARRMVEAEAERSDRTVTLLTSLVAPGEGITEIVPEQAKVQLRAIEERGLALAPSELDKARVLWTMGQVWTRYGETAQALLKLEEARRLMLAILGDNSREVLFLQTDTLPALLGELELEKARVLGERTVASLEERVPASHHRLVQCRLNLAAILVELRDLEKAEEQLMKVTGEDPDAPWLRSYADCIRASIFEEQGRFDEALRLDRPAAAGLSAWLGRTHPYTLFARNNMGSVLALQAGTKGGPLLDEAIEVLQNVVTDRRMVLGARHRSTILSEINLAAVWSQRIVWLRSAEPSRRASMATLLKEGIALLEGVVGRIDEDRDNLIAELPRALAAQAMFLLWAKQDDLAEAAAARAVTVESQCAQSGKACLRSNAKEVLEFIQQQRRDQ